MTANDELEQLSKIFKSSKAVFTITSTRDDNRVEFDLQTQYDPNTELNLDQDPVLQLLAYTHRESFSKEKQCMVGRTDPRVAYNKIEQEIRDFHLLKSPLKQPGQSTLGKWIRNSFPGNHSEHSIGVIHLYRYIKEHWNESKDGPNVQNAMAILELMMEKYEK